MKCAIIGYSVNHSRRCGFKMNTAANAAPIPASLAQSAMIGSRFMLESP